MPEITDAYLAELEEMIKALVPGGWGFIEQKDARYPQIGVWHEIDNASVACQCAGPESIDEVRANMKFIAASRLAVPALVAEVRHLSNHIRELNGEIDELTNEVEAERERANDAYTHGYNTASQGGPWI